MVLIYWVGAYILYGKTQAVVLASKETGLEVSVYGYVSRSECRTEWEHSDA